MNFSELFGQFHFLRPEWLWLLPLPVLFYFSQKLKQAGGWRDVIDPHLLQFMQLKAAPRQSRQYNLLPILALLGVIAAAGPAFRQQPVPLFQTEQARVIVLDLSLSMLAQDLQPSRLHRARFKIQDILQRSREGSVGLVVYAGDAFVISPLTHDANTIANMVPVLSPLLMPVLGSDPVRGIEQAKQLLTNAKQQGGQIVWITDGIEPEQAEKVVSQLQDEAIELAILALGSAEGAPIPLPNDKGFLKDEQGNIVVPKLDLSPLQLIQEKLNARLTTLTADDTDINYLLRQSRWQQEISQDAESKQTANRWYDDGYWLVWLILIGLAYQFLRREHAQTQSLLSLLVISLAGFLPVSPANASVWDALWLSPQQRAEKAFRAGNYEEAAKLSRDPAWQAAALYRQGNYSKSAQLWQQGKTADDHYNRGNALAKAGQLAQAISAYEQALKLDPGHEDAKFNKQLVEQLLKQQQQQQQQQKQEQQQQSSQQQSPQSDSNQQQDNQQQNNNQQQQQESAQQQQDDSQQSKQQKQQQEVETQPDERNEQEKDQALQHWLQKIPDDPGGLLRNKMYREYQKRGRQKRTKKIW